VGPAGASSWAWHVSLGTNERLERLSDGSVAVVRAVAPIPESDPDLVDGGDEVGAPEPTTFDSSLLAPIVSSSTATTYATTDPDATADGDTTADSYVTDPDTGETYYYSTTWTEPYDATIAAAYDDGSPSTDSPDALDDTLATDDPPEYPDDDSLADDVDGMALLNAAQELTANQVIAVLAPPSAADAAGAAVPASFTVSGDSVILSVRGTGAYPITANARLGFNQDAGGTTAANASLRTLAATAASPPDYSPSSCASIARILTFNPNGWEPLLTSMKQFPASCANYYVAVPPYENGKPRNPAGVRAYNDAAKARFIPVAEFNWGKSGLNNRRVNPYRVGVQFRIDMAKIGYKVENGETWVVDEIPSSVLTSSIARKRVRLLIRGLYGEGTNLRKSRGMVWMVFRGQDPNGIETYKTRLEGLQRDAPAFWSAMKAYTQIWSQEVYPWCPDYACPRGATLGAKARHVNQYTMHPARLAFASNSQALQTVRDTFRAGYMPFENAFWTPVPPPCVAQGTCRDPNLAYHTRALNTDQMMRFVSLQVYATRAWALAPGKPYPRRRIGFAWNQHTRARAAQTQAVATRLAKALRGAYSLNGTPRYACSLSGSSTRLCNPSVASAHFTEAWETFARW
jgi:hypothetical protein